VNNAAKDASLSVYFQPGMSRPTWSIIIITDGVPLLRMMYDVLIEVTSVNTVQNAKRHCLH